MSAVVNLTVDELRLAAAVGVERQIQALQNSRRPVYGEAAGGDWQAHIEGAAAEMAVARWFDRFWAGALGDLMAADVGKLQVRATRHPNGSLILHDRDKDNDAFILVIGVSPRFLLAGWIYARDGKQQQYWRTDTGRPAFFVPQGALRSFAASPAAESAA
jgi:hypothetical protein